MNNPSNESPHIPSPCVRCCCLDLDDVCVGCFRTLEEITSWNSMSDSDKLNVLEKCKLRERGQLKGGD